MRKFYNRQDEIQALQDIHKESQSSSKFTYILGHRRVGKTRLLKKVFLGNTFSEKNKVLYFFVERKSVESLLSEFSKIIKQQLAYSPPFTNLDNFIEYLFELSKKENITIIFDEFQNFLYIDKSLFSTLQKYWDQNKHKTKINLIVSGSLYSTMEKIFVSKHEPLFGRTTDRMVIKPFGIPTLVSILSDHGIKSFRDLLKFYTFFNGIPKYWDHLEERNLFKNSAVDIFRKLFLDTRAPLKEEGKTIMMEEFGPEYNIYFSILEAIAVLSKTSAGKISSYTGIPSNRISTYLKKLNQKFKLVKTNTSLLNNQGKNRYILQNRFLKTWFRYIFSNSTLVEMNNIDTLSDLFKKDFPTYQGLAFEELTLQLLKSDYKHYPYKQWGKYWDKNREIDILGIHKQDKRILIGECKLNEKSVGKKVFKKLEENADYLAKLLPGYNIEKIVFTIDRREKKKNIKL